MFPASAGMNRRSPKAADDDADVPRKRGDEPMFCYVTHIRQQCSPQARG